MGGVLGCLKLPQPKKENISLLGEKPSLREMDWAGGPGKEACPQWDYMGHTDILRKVFL